LDFRVVIERAGGSFSAFSPDLPGCVATGKTRTDSRRRMRKAIKCHIECREQDAVKNLKCAACGKTAKRVTGLKYKSSDFHRFPGIGPLAYSGNERPLRREGGVQAVEAEDVNGRRAARP